MKKYQIEDNDLMFFAEMAAMMYCSIAILTVMSGPLSILPRIMEAELQDRLRALLREPLRDSFFRKEFNNYFSVHAAIDVREVAWPWMQEVLTWES